MPKANLRAPPARAIAAAGAALIAAYLAVLAGYGLLAEPAPSDLAVVLGNDVTLGGQPVPRTQARLDAAVAAYRAGLVPRVLVSGGVTSGRDEAAVMAAYLVAQGVPRSAVLEDLHGINTMATAVDTAALVPVAARILVVTQWFHVPRSVMAMRSVGFTQVSATWPRWAEWRDVYSFLREAVGVPVYAVRERFAPPQATAISPR